MNTSNWLSSGRKLGRILAFFLLAAIFPRAGFGANFYQGVATNNLPWPGGIIPYVFSTNITTNEQTVYLDGMKDWELAANIHFVPRTNQTDYVLLQFDYTQGTDTFVASFPEAVMTVDTLSRAQVCHETGHLLGFQHEHVRTDRNSYITVNFANLVGSGTNAGTNGSGEGSGSVSNLYVIDTNSTAFGAYDIESVMHYSRTLFSTDPDNLDTIDPNSPYYAEYYYRVGNYALSPGDRAGAAYLYGPPATALTNFVTNTADVGLGSLRAAIYYANDHPGTTIHFNIAPNDPGYSNGVYTIYLTGELPPLVANGTVIDATTQSGYSNHPVVALSGAQLIPQLTYPGDFFNCGLRLYAANCTIDGLSIHDFPFLGVAVEYALAVSNRVEGCYIGVAPNSTNAAGNGYQGVSIDTGASYNFIGGTSTNQRNVISGNAQYGVFIAGTNGQFGATKIGTNTVGNVVQGNYIGTDATGSFAVSNRVGGVIVYQDAWGVTVGGTNSGSGNVLSGNVGAGLFLIGASNDVVQGNYIGLNAAGTAAIPNSDSGIYVVAGASSNVIGGTVTGARNVISGNTNDGIYISDPGTGNLVVQGNYIGTGPGGTNAFPNKGTGIGIWSGAANVLVGGTNAGAGNLVSGNADGISLGGTGVNGVQIYGNYVGVASNGVTALPNSVRGVYLQAGAQSNYIGGSLPGQGNLISGNGSDGIQFYNSGTSFNTIQGNYIGTTKTGLSPLGNGGSAIYFNSAENNTIGGTNAGARNVLCASIGNGIFIDGASNEVIQGNYIGVGEDGVTGIGNGLQAGHTQAGIYVLFSPNNLIGGTAAGAGNVISANGNGGVDLYGSGTTGTTVQGNYIGTTKTGLSSLGNSGAAVSFIGAPNNLLGGTTAAARNLLCAGSGNGIFIGSGSVNNLIEGNYIGVGADGATGLGNGYLGIYVLGGVSNVIGGTAAGSGNVISDNTADGVQFYGQGTSYNTVEGNLIGTTATGLASLPNTGSGMSFLYGPQSNTVGGPTASARNVLSGNSYDGIYLAYASNIIVQANYIGVGSDGATALGNGNNGIDLESGSTTNVIGLVLNGSGAGNVIANNSSAGINVYDTNTVGNTFRGNSIYSNNALGIELDGDSGNHVGGAIPGPNDYQNYPVITNASVALGATTIGGTLNSTANRGFLVDVYRNTSPDPSGYGEGQVYVGSANLTTAGSGNGSFTLTTGGGFAGQYFTAVATDATTGDSSEFCLDFVATNGPTPLSFLGPYTWNRTNGFNFSMALQSNQSYTVQMTTNLAAKPIVWTNLTNFTATNSTVQFDDHAATNQTIPARFYRIVSP